MKIVNDIKLPKKKNKKLVIIQYIGMELNYFHTTLKSIGS